MYKVSFTLCNVHIAKRFETLERAVNFAQTLSKVYELTVTVGIDGALYTTFTNGVES